MITDVTPVNQCGSNLCKQVKISVDKEIASAFKKTCADSNVSMAATISKFMAEYTGTAANRRHMPDYSTKRQRRAVIRKYIKGLEQIKDHEESYRDAIPANLEGSIVYENAEEAVAMLEEVLELLEAY
jgi:hypothetical protein